MPGAGSLATTPKLRSRGAGLSPEEKKTLVTKRDKGTIDTLTSFYALDGTATTIASIVYKEEILSRLLL